jgi:hypothetical protein
MRFSLSILLFFCFSVVGFAQESGDIYVHVPDGKTGRVFLDGKDTGQDAPTTLKAVPQGRHQIQVRGECTIASDDVFLVRGGVERVDLDPIAMGGFVEIEVSPNSAKVYLDQKPIGNGPSLGIEVDCGRHTFSFRALQFVTTERTIDIGMGNVERIEVRMQQSGTGTIAVLVDPAQADVFLDGSKVSTGPGTLTDIAEGSHLVGAMLDGFIPLEQRVTVKSGESTRVDLTLQAVSGDDPHAEHTPPAEPAEETPSEAPSAQAQVLEIPISAEGSKRGRSRIGRQLAGGSLLGASAVTAWLSWQNWHSVTMPRYSRYIEKNQDSTYYDQQVLPSQLTSVGLGVAAGVTLLSGSALLYYDHSGTGIHFSGRF